MPRISKKTNFFRRNYFYITGGIWGVVGILMIIFQIVDFMAYGYAIIGLTYAVVGYFKKGLPLEFISWDEEKIEISDGSKVQDLINGPGLKELMFHQPT